MIYTSIHLDRSILTDVQIASTNNLQLELASNVPQSYSYVYVYVCVL